MRKIIWFIMLTLAAAAPALAAPRPDPGVTLELGRPAEKAGFLPGQTFEVRARVGDPDNLVRRVFVRLTDAGGASLNADQDAVRRGGDWTINLALPASARPGPYTVHVDVLGEGNTPLQWARRTIEVKPAKFAMTVAAPSPDAVFRRNEWFDVVVRLNDPSQKARRVFVLFDDPKRHVVLNGDRDAARRGELWIDSVHVPATAWPGAYRVVVKAVGEGMEPLAEQAVPVTITEAPVSLGRVRLAPASRIVPGTVVKARATLSDPNHVVRKVVVTCLDPHGKPLFHQEPAALVDGAWTHDLDLDPDQPYGTYRVEFEALAQGGEVVGTSQITFVVLKQP